MTSALGVVVVVGHTARMSNTACPVCSLTDVAVAADHYECLTCGHEWSRVDDAANDNDDDGGVRVVKDANGNVLVDGDDVVLIKELKLKGGGGSIKSGTKVKRIKLVDGDHELDVKIDGVAIMLKAMFVKKA